MMLSIVIPVYKTEKTIERCIESIISQNYQDFEIILVDNGSPDHCPAICDAIARKYRFVKVLHQENSGLSEARNAGIKKATGEYITFVDSDDELAPNTLLPLMKELKENPYVDILEYPVLERKGHPRHEKYLTFPSCEYQDSMEYWLETKAYLHTYAWNKIYRKTLFDKVRFPKGRKYEDAYILPRILGIVSTNLKPCIKTTQAGMYLYYWNEEGITANAKTKDLRQLYETNLETLVHCCHGEVTDKRIQYFMVVILNIMLDLYEMTGTFEQDSLFFKIFRQTRHLKPFKLRILAVIGYRNLCRMNKLVHKFYKR